jgi:uncharacterized protein
MTDRLLTPTKITAWLDCAHFLNLRHQVDRGVLTVAPSGFGSLASLLVAKGRQHEADCLAEYRNRGLNVLEIPGRDRGESFSHWVARIGNPLASEYDVIYQMPFIHEGIRGIADFLLRVEDGDPDSCRWEPVDAKLARSEAKPGHVLQLCFYVEALEALTGRPPRRMHLWLGSGDTETLATEEFEPYWRRLRRQLTSLLDEGSEDPETAPEPCAHCPFCEFHQMCTQVWRDDDSLIYVAGLRGADQAHFQDAGVETLGQLATRRDPIEGLAPKRFTRLARQASLQERARQSQGPPPVEIIEPTEDTIWGRGFELMPEPDDGDVFLDLEGDPFWRADAGLFFLFGLIVRSGEINWDYQAIWAHGHHQEAVATGALIAYLKDRRQTFPDMHVYHYNHTERSALERLTADHGVAEAALIALIETGFFVDLLPVVRNAVQVGTESYGLKDLEPVTGYVRGHDIDQGSAAVIEYEEYMADHDEVHLDRIAAYNADDVRSTLALRDWLVARRPPHLEWRAPRLEAEEVNPELDAQVEALHTHGPETPEHLLGDLLGYWWREHRAHMAQQLSKTLADAPVLVDDPEVIAGLSYQGPVERIGQKGKPLKWGGVRFRFPDQPVSPVFGSDRTCEVVYPAADGAVGYADVDHIDPESHEVVLVWNGRSQDLGVFPATIVVNGWVRSAPKPNALGELAAKVLDPEQGPPNGVSLALLRRELPRFEEGQGPDGGTFGDDVDAILDWVPYLDHSYVAIQGPPGTGKTFRGAHIVHELISRDKRVGIMAMSHTAIDNLLSETVNVFDEKGDRDKLRCIRKDDAPDDGGLPGVEYSGSSERCANDEFNLVAGTAWLFSNKAMKESPVDVLIIDEAGQLALADALAASRSAQNLILLGDPLQLPQVTKASHPGGGGLSVLEHVLGQGATMPPDRGVFLRETRRMHPDVCRFISDQIYEGRLLSHPSCAAQGTEFGTGLRWLEADHADRSTESEEEAALVVAEIRRLLGTNWTDQHGRTSPLGVGDFMVVAPYNDQVHLLRDHLQADARTRGVVAGTVDKFQGREAPVVFFTMTTSSAEDMPRGAEFLFSRNRLNVAISRARCLAYLVCTEEILNSRARDVEEMRLISTLCSFVEYCTPSARASQDHAV